MIVNDSREREQCVDGLKLPSPKREGKKERIQKCDGNNCAVRLDYVIEPGLCDALFTLAALAAQSTLKSSDALSAGVARWLILLN